MEIIDPICEKCKHFTPYEGGCKAFPDGIPNEILEANEHNRPIEGQKNEIAF